MFMSYFGLGSKYGFIMNISSVNWLLKVNVSVLRNDWFCLLKISRVNWSGCFLLLACVKMWLFTGELEIQGTERLKKEEILDAKIKRFLSVRRNFCAVVSSPVHLYQAKVYGPGMSDTAPPPQIITQIKVTLAPCQRSQKSVCDIIYMSKCSMNCFLHGFYWRNIPITITLLYSTKCFLSAILPHCHKTSGTKYSPFSSTHI